MIVWTVVEALSSQGACRRNKLSFFVVDFQRVKSGLASLVFEFLFTAGSLMFDVIETDTFPEYFFPGAFADRPGLLIVMVDDIGGATKIARKVFATGSFAIG